MNAPRNRTRLAPPAQGDKGDYRSTNAGAVVGPPGAEYIFPGTACGEHLGSGQNANPGLNPDFALVRTDYRVRLAGEQSPLHTRAGKLVATLYGSRGLVTAATPFADRQPEQVTLAATTGNRVFGTLTLGVDSGAGLLADSLYRPEIDELRTRGNRLCEVTRLAIDPELSCPEVMATMFNVAFVLAKDVHARTDMLAEVHPRHAAFYRRTMGYRMVGPVRFCERVSAPAVLMHLCLDFARSQIRQLAGDCAQKSRSLYKLFLPPHDQELLLKKLTASDPADNRVILPSALG